ncbi:FHA domain-containing protein DDL [Drosophila mauritiana]|uniref:FHA domain-containing protein DDL n=1 Tax=Drosophila mauritiana TaxID=7226 RepID=A0A6P8KTV0_DROMA|nr:FHA domain-containing protein DDL [Drosophila mauritiana]
MNKRRHKERELEQQRNGQEGDTKMNDRNLSKTKKIKQRATRDSSSLSDSSNESNKSNHSSLSPNRKQPAIGKRQRDSSDSQEKRPKQLTKPSEDVHEQRSKWDSPERSSSHRNSTRQRRNSRSRSRERSERERDRDRERNREQDCNMQSSKERCHRSSAQRHRSRSSERKNRERDHQRRSTERRPVRRSQSPRDRYHHGGRDLDQRRQRNQRRDNSNKNEDDHYVWGKEVDDKVPGENDVPVDKEKPNFGLSGALTEDTNKLNGVVVKYSEPPEARKPKRRWRLYPFKGETALPTLHIHRQSCFLVGRDRKVVDLAVDHPSCSKQHAALQYRLVPFEREDGSHGKRVRLYLIDLDSANGTFLNNKKIDARKYYELIEKDVIKFGFSSREYVLLHENSKEDEEDDDVHIKDEPQDAPVEVANP